MKIIMQPCLKHPSERIFPRRHSESVEKANGRVLFVILLCDCWGGREGSDGGWGSGALGLLEWTRPVSLRLVVTYSTVVTLAHGRTQ